ncbi:hypothetical protein JNB62_05460 [Microbacterium jejuense]|uniref:Uncharacterized protein n=1 Tax=Microbacterium jejuense TaxID=1263637 RepID=A0ABS7HJX8_9MICO|nr:hypothetical protein [Microbacterium jejuense]MBW9093123.1 hypothetical protein [Microbacterium jejuense]
MSSTSFIVRASSADQLGNGEDLMALPGDDTPLTDAREYTWHGLRGRWGFPAWAEKLHKRMLLWLDGEEVVYAEYGWDNELPDERYAYDITEARSLWVFVLTTRFALSVEIEKAESGTEAARVTRWELVNRSAITSLDAKFPPEVQEALGLTLHVKYDGITRDVTIPAYQPIEPPADRRVPLFASLRDDLYAE